MRIKAVLLVVVLLATSACATVPRNYLYVDTPAGLTVVWPDNMGRPDLAQIDKVFADTHACAGAPAMPKPMVFFSRTEGKADLHLNIAFTNRSDFALRHELLHLILHHADLSDEDNAAHKSVYFQRCAPDLRKYMDPLGL